MINWNEVEKNWSQFKPKIHSQWDKLTEANLTEIKGKRETLELQLEKVYKLPKPDAQKQITDFLKSQPASVAKN